MLVRVLSGESSRAERCRAVTEVEIALSPPGPGTRERDAVLTLDVDANAILRVTVKTADGSSAQRDISLRGEDPACPEHHNARESVLPELVEEYSMSIEYPPAAPRLERMRVQAWLARTLSKRRGSRAMEGLSKVESLRAWLAAHPNERLPVEFADSPGSIVFGSRWNQLREAVVDKLEEHFGVDLAELRYASSIGMMAMLYMAALGGAAPT
jgi:hypothetical protein